MRCEYCSKKPHCTGDTEIKILVGSSPLRGVTGDRIAIDQNLDGTEVSSEIAGVLVSHGQRGRRDACVGLIVCGDRYPSRAWSSKRFMGSLAFYSWLAIVARAQWLVMRARAFSMGMSALRHSSEIEVGLKCDVLRGRPRQANNIPTCSPVLRSINDGWGFRCNSQAAKPSPIMRSAGLV
jgi:hypothetical protein